MQTQKWFLWSLGVLGPVLVFVAAGLAIAGVEFSPEQQAALVGQWEVLGTAGLAMAGSIVGLIGRVRAKASLTFFRPPKEEE